MWINTNCNASNTVYSCYVLVGSLPTGQHSRALLVPSLFIVLPPIAVFLWVTAMSSSEDTHAYCVCTLGHGRFRRTKSIRKQHLLTRRHGPHSGTRPLGPGCETQPTTTSFYDKGHLPSPSGFCHHSEALLPPQ